MLLHIEDLIGHVNYDKIVDDGADIAAVISLLEYDKYDMYHTVNEKHERFDYKLKDGDVLALIPVLGGG